MIVDSKTNFSRRLEKTAQYRLCLLGEFGILSSDGHKVFVKQTKFECLLAALASSRNDFESRRFIEGLLWSNSDTPNRSMSLRRLLSDADNAAVGHFVVRKTGALGLNRKLVTTDLCLIERLSPFFDVEEVSRQFSTIGRPLFGLDHVDPEFDNWIRQERTFIAESVERKIQKLIFQIDRSDSERISILLRILLRIDPTNEAVAEKLIVVLAHAEKLSAAKEVFDNLRIAMREHLDIEPSERVVAALMKVTADRSVVTNQRTVGESPKFTNVPSAVSQSRIGGSEVSSKISPIDSNHQSSGIIQGEQVTLAVLAPINLTGDQVWCEYLDGLGESLCLGLHRFKWLGTRAYASFRSITPAHEESFELLNSNYILVSSLNKNRGFVTLTSRLEERDSRTTIWGDNFRLARESNGAIDEEVASEISIQVSSVLLARELKAADRRPQSDWSARKYVFKALGGIYSLDPKQFSKAGDWLRIALETDPHCAQAHSWLAFWHTLCLGQNWSVGSQNHLVEAQKHANLANVIDPYDAQSQAILAHFTAFIEKDMDQAMELFADARHLNPNCGFTAAFSAASFSYAGRTDEALEHLGRYKQIMPFHPHGDFLDGIYCVAHSCAGNHSDAVSWGRRLLRACPNFVNGYKHLISNLGSLGYIEEATKYRAQLQKFDSEFTIKSFLETYPLIGAQNRERIAEGLRRAGVDQ